MVREKLLLENKSRKLFEPVIREALAVHVSDKASRDAAEKFDNDDPLRLWTSEIEQLTRVSKIKDVAPAYSMLA